MSSSVEIKGNERLMRFLNNMPRFVRESGDKICSEAASQASKEARRIVPVRTGRLKRSIRKEQTGQGAYRVGSKVEYAGYVEYGTSRMQAQPYLRPAAELVNTQLNGIIYRLLKEQVGVDYELVF
jgi:HK97 gp10 family phage protein